ncbi:cytochrome P450 [Microdochium bolleyi]|uniref:Cytochrome P450 n=1 Tax=Microdochium bolleyi TaxID=196109 RepID=A0A136IYF4_9PEZI|nr:cytochrome P450 [Microdochium bolleyi]
MIVQIVPAVLGALLAVIAAQKLYEYFRSPLRSVQGPWLARITPAWYAYKISQGSFHQLNCQLHQHYGPIVRYAPNRYSISDLGEVKTIYGLGTSFPKSTWYDAWGPPGEPTLFNDRSLTRHAHTRKLFQAAYSMSALVHYEGFVDECANLFKVRLLELSAAANGPVDMRHWFQCYAFDVIGVITYGRRMGFLDRGEDMGGMIEAVESSLVYASLAGVFPALHRVLSPIGSLIAGSKSSGRAYIVKATMERMREVQAKPELLPYEVDDNNDQQTLSLLQKFLAKHSTTPESFTRKHVLAGCVSNMVAGSDTTAISLSAVLYYLLKNPASMAKLRAEIDDLVAKGELSGNPTFKESQNMPYLQAVIKEALRLHPATGLPLERVIPRGGATISGQFFPEGTIVGINTWVAHHDRGVFGQNANDFSPERWLTKDAEKLTLMNRFWMPFGAGSRTCIGRHISMLEMCKLLPLLIRDFDFSLPPSLNHKEWSTESYWFIKPVDFKVLIQPRQATAV